MRTDIAARAVERVGHERDGAAGRPGRRETDVEEEFAELEVDAPLVGSSWAPRATWRRWRRRRKELEDRGIRNEVRVMSAHRDPDVGGRLRQERPDARPAGDHRRRRPVGRAARRRRRAHRPACHRRAAHQRTSVAGGLDALLAIAQMPPGVPVACVGVDNAQQRRGARRADPRVLRRDRPLHPPRDGRRMDRRARMECWRAGRGRGAEEIGRPTPEDLDGIRAATFTVEAVNEREKVTDHDMAAFVDVLSASAGPGGRWIHFGLTSLRRARHGAGAAAQRRRARCSSAGARACGARSPSAPREHVDTLCVGRTHGVQAEPTTFGVKLAGFAFEAHRNLERLERAFEQAAVGGLSGAVGTYAATSPDFERACLERLELRPEHVSTQVVPRDRHAEVLQAIALAGAGLERSPPRSATSSARRCARSRSRSGRARRARRRCRTSATRSSPSGSPASRACCAATRRRPSRTSRSGTSATSRTRRSSA